MKDRNQNYGALNIMAIFLFIFTMVVMSLVMLLFKKRVRSMEEDFNEEMEGK